MHAAAIGILTTLVLVASSGEVCDNSCSERSSALLQVHSAHHRPQAPREKSSTEVAEFPNRIAAVLVLRTLDECRVSRARDLVSSMSPGIDTWLLHADEPQRPEFFAQLHGLNIRIEKQAHVPGKGGWRNFGSSLSGYSKAAFLKFAIHHPEYNFVWQVEDDIVFTGSWGTLFEQLQHEFPTQSLLSKIVYQNFNANKSYFKPACRTPAGGPCGSTLGIAQDAMGYAFKVQGSQKASLATRSNNSLVHVHVDWLLTRVSHQFAVKLGSELDSATGARGHHEGISGPFCVEQHKSRNKGWCTMAELPRKHIGVFETGHWGNWTSLIARQTKAGELKKNRLYHPDKCECSQ